MDFSNCTLFYEILQSSLVTADIIIKSKKTEKQSEIEKKTREP